MQSHISESSVSYSYNHSYFSVYALQHFYLPSPIHSKYINLEVLNRYLPVGGVRIEDDILITAKAYENLTTAPKGDEMLEIIRSGRSNTDSGPARRQSGRTQINEDEPPLLRAPGISATAPQSILRPIARASTMPVELRQDKTVDFEPYEGPSLFSNFRRSMTTDEKIQHWQRDHNSASTTAQHTSVCGSNAREVKHIYLTSGSFPSGPNRAAPREQFLPPCTQCKILCETLDRLRQSLSTSRESPKSELDVPPAVSQKQVRNQRRNPPAARQDLRADRGCPQHDRSIDLARGLSGMCLEGLDHVCESPPFQRRTAHSKEQNHADHSSDATLRSVQPSLAPNQLSAQAASDVILRFQPQGPAVASDRRTFGNQGSVTNGIPAMSRAKNFHTSTGDSTSEEARRVEE